MFDIDFCEKINQKIKSEIDAFLKNLNIESDKRNDFDDINFEIIFAHDVCFFDIANEINKINKINLMKMKKIMKNVENKINDEIESCFANKTILLNRDETI